MLSDRTLTDFVAVRGTELKRFAYLLCGGNSHEADELVQDALVRVLTSFRRAPIDNLEAYVKRAIVNRHIDAFRKRQVIDRPPKTSTYAPTTDLAITVAARQDILAALRALSRQQRACVVLRYFDDKTVKQVSAELDIEEGTVKRHLQDACVRLAPLLRGWSDHDSER